MDISQPTEDLVEKGRLDVVEKYAAHLASEAALARQGDGFFDRKYWADFVSTKALWQKSSNDFYVLLHELAK